MKVNKLTVSSAEENDGNKGKCIKHPPHPAETDRLGIITSDKHNDYAFNFDFYFREIYKTGILDIKMGVYFLSSDNPFVSFANKLNTGIIYGGMNYDNSFIDSREIGYADFNFVPRKYPFLFIGGGVFRYTSPKSALNNRNYYASELNLRVGADFDTWGFKLSGALFSGEALFLGNPSTENQIIKKIQANFFYKFVI